MSKINVYVYSKIPNLSKEVKKILPSIAIHDVESDDIDKLKQAEIVVADFDLMAPHIYNLPKLKWLQGTWAGVDKIVPHVSKPLPFLMTRFSGQHFGRMMSEYIIACIVNYERDFKLMDLNQQNQIWSKEGKISNYRNISDLTIGILGLGNIGCWVGRCLNMLGAKILGYGSKIELNPSVDYISPESYYTKNTLPEFLKRSDYIINTLPTTNHTTGLLNGNILKNCEEKRTTFINVGRGTIIDEDDLVYAIKNQWLSGAILDVFHMEPLPKSSPLWTMKEVQITPHVSAESKPLHIAELFKENLSLYLENKPISTTFVLDKGY
ncbi:hypothetical protein FQA39_LY11335 [Lamprigera yunnana]|nr:hypothetical protein FQA39_LY11335 [Lamprigera yunnana]